MFERYSDIQEGDFHPARPIDQIGIIVFSGTLLIARRGHLIDHQVGRLGNPV
jgi:hypothetical protein